MFQTVEMAPPDAILGLTEAFRADTNPDKINLSVGVFQTADGKTPVLTTVKEAEKRLIDSESTKSYLPMTGDAGYGRHVQQLILGAGHPVLEAGRAATAHAPGGTGALRVVGDYVRGSHPTATLWMSDPTWANHAGIFGASGLTLRSYPYYDADTFALDFGAMKAALQEIPEGDLVLLHGCCHNPTGVDPSVEQWLEIGQILRDRKAVPIVDFAYQGFADGLDADAAGLRALCESVDELFVCTSYSKNFGLYRERVGAVTVISGDAATTKAVESHLKLAIRRNYSNPPAHGGLIVATILDDAELRRQWEGELAEMRNRINSMRQLLADGLTQRGVRLNPAGNDFVTSQRGMFSMTGLTKDQVQRLRDEYAIYIVGSGRINVAGINEGNVDRLCDAIRTVVNG